MGPDGKSSSRERQEELTRLQRDGIAARLANNPVVGFMGIELLEVRVGHATLLLPYREELRNSMGTVQGGILATLADVAGGVSLYSVLPDPLKVVIPTVEFKLNFLRPADREDVIARGRIVHQGKQIALCQVDVATGEEKLLATGLLTYMIREIEMA